MTRSGRRWRRSCRPIPTVPDAVSALGVLCYLAHDTRGEEACWERCLALDPSNALAYSRLLALAEQEANYQRIVDLAHEAEARDPRNVAHRGPLGSALMYLQRYDEAKTVLERHVSDGHADADTYLVLGEVWYQLDEPRKAKRCFRGRCGPRAVQLRHGVQSGQGVREARRNRTGHAVPDQVPGIEERGNGRPSRAMPAHGRKYATRCIFRSVSARSCGTWARPTRQANELALAEKSWLRGAELNPDDTESRELLCDLYHAPGTTGGIARVGPRIEAHRAAESSARPQRRPVPRAVSKRYDEAEQVFRELCRREPTGSAGYAALAELLLRRGGDVREAQSLAQRSRRIRPERPAPVSVGDRGPRSGRPADRARGHRASPGARTGKSPVSEALCVDLQPEADRAVRAGRWRWAIVGLGVVAIAGLACSAAASCCVRHANRMSPRHRPRPASREPTARTDRRSICKT